MQGPHQEVLSNYIYNKQSPTFTGNNYTIWQGRHAQTNVPVTIKLLKYPHIELPKYLKKLKDVKSQFVIKVYQFNSDQTSLLLITQQVIYGSLKKALFHCEHLQQNDALFIARALLSGNVQALRMDLNWYGTQDDIQFTDSGLKLSWNNSCSFNLVNPFPNIIGKLVTRTQAAKNASLLPFPQIKGIVQLVKISKQNASQIAMHPQMKHKVKYPKRKGKHWMGLRQVKNKNQYFDESVYLAVSSDYGFVRIKVYEQGRISPNLIQLNKTNNNFTRVLQHYDQGGKTFIISQYANDGNLQNYIKRLKTAGVTLKQDQIQFFFYSLFQPLKGVQASTLKSINMLHIKNIFLENGIPKIGQPVPFNSKLEDIMSDRADVPDFYHSDFKHQPSTNNITYDTYSLGVLLYKLMYTQYPIFPNSKVHIPTAPPFNKRLKSSLQIFLNDGGALKELQKKIQIDENVAKQVKQNMGKLMMQVGIKPVQTTKKKTKVVANMQQQQSQNSIQQTQSKVSIIQNGNQAVTQQSQQQQGCCSILWSKLQLQPAAKIPYPSPFLDLLHNSPFRKCRIWSKVILLIILYLFAYYFAYIQRNVTFLSDQNIIQKVTVSIGGSNYNITTSNYYAFTTQYALTTQNLNALTSGMGCLVDNLNGAPVYSSTVRDNSTEWIAYCVAGIALVFGLMVFKAFQIHVVDLIKAWHFRQQGTGKFNLTNFFLINLVWAMLMSGHFFLFNFIYYGHTQPCLKYQNEVMYGSSQAFFADMSKFTGIYMAVFIAQIIFAIVFLVFIGCNQHIKYNKILNPITIFAVGILIFALIVRFGAIFNQNYYPSAGNDSLGMIKGMFTRGEWLGIVGILPQIMVVAELLVCLIVDLLFWTIIDKSQVLLSNDASVVNDGLEDLV